MKTTIYEIVLYPKGSINPEIKVWHLFTKKKEEVETKAVKKNLYLRLGEKAA